MHLNGSSTPAAHTLGPQRAWRTHLHREAEDTATLATRTHIVAQLTGRTGATPRLEVKGKGRLREAALVSQRRYLGNERPPSIGKGLPGGSISIGTVGDGLFHNGACDSLACFHYRQGALVVRSVPWQHGHRRNQLTLGVHRHLGLMPVEAPRLALPAVAHLGVMVRDHPVAGHALPEVGALLPSLNIWGQQSAQQSARRG